MWLCSLLHSMYKAEPQITSISTAGQLDLDHPRLSSPHYCEVVGS
jgi:hypothetical protein